jgi:uncharacterized UBP type Zn finger protein
VPTLSELFIRLIYGRRKIACSHLDQIRDVTPSEASKASIASNASAPGCEDCLPLGDTWVHLRLCLTCGHVGCCDQSKNKHATAHFHATQHPIVRSLERGEQWRWCYLDRAMV